MTRLWTYEEPTFHFISDFFMLVTVEQLVFTLGLPVVVLNSKSRNVFVLKSERASDSAPATGFFVYLQTFIIMVNIFAAI